MTPHVWMVPAVLFAAVVSLWASAWFETRVAPRESHPQLRTLPDVDTALVDTAPSGEPLDVDAPLAAQPAHPAV